MNSKPPIRARILKAALIVALLPLILLALLLFALRRAILYALVWLLWLPKGKDTLVVYSNSPIWLHAREQIAEVRKIIAQSRHLVASSLLIRRSVETARHEMHEKAEKLRQKRILRSSRRMSRLHAAA